MSNPAVTKLRKLRIAGSKIWLDDNIGEAIHLHIDDIRIDFCYKEFAVFCDDLCLAVNELVNVYGFDCKYIDPQYFEFMLWKNILELEAVKIEKVSLNKLLCPADDGSLKPLSESRIKKAIEGDRAENSIVRPSDHIGQTSQNRVDEVFSSVKEFGYPYNNQFIILYNDDMIIQDGQHRAASLLKLYGDIEVPVMRLFFSNYKTRSEKSSIWRKYRFLGFCRQLAIQLKSPISLAKKVYRKMRSFVGKKVIDYKRNRYIKNYNQDHFEIVRLLESK